MRHELMMKVRSKIWIVNGDEEVVFGSGRAQILKAIEEHGSILAASKALHMSYRAVWGKIKASEKRLGRPLVEKRVGSYGGGSDLTPFARAILEHFTHMDDLIRSASDKLFHDDFIASMADGSIGPCGKNGRTGPAS